MDPILRRVNKAGNSQVTPSRVSLSLYLTDSGLSTCREGSYSGVRKNVESYRFCRQQKTQAIKNPPKRVCTKTIPTPCRLPSRRWSIVPDPGELLVHQLLDPMLLAWPRLQNSQRALLRVSLLLYVCGNWSNADHVHAAWKGLQAFKIKALGATGQVQGENVAAISQ